MVQQDQPLARLGVGQADPAGGAVRRVGDHAARAQGLQRRIVEGEQRLERRQGQGEDAKCHWVSPSPSM